MWVVLGVLFLVYAALRIGHAIKTDPEGYKQFLTRRITTLLIFLAIAWLLSLLADAIWGPT